MRAPLPVGGGEGYGEGSTVKKRLSYGPPLTPTLSPEYGREGGQLSKCFRKSKRWNSPLAAFFPVDRYTTRFAGSNTIDCIVSFPCAAPASIASTLPTSISPNVCFDVSRK